LADPLSLLLSSFDPSFVGMDSHIVTNEALITTVGYIRVVDAVPEPASVVLFAAGLSTLLTVRRSNHGALPETSPFPADR
jgi:hypothetical protein